MRCLLQALTLLYLVYDTAHAPSGACPSTRYCSPCDDSNVICTLNSLFNITYLLNFGPSYLPVNKLIINGCPKYDKIETNINVNSLELNCSFKSIIPPYELLFKSWSPSLVTISNEGSVYTKRIRTGNLTCQLLCDPSTVAAPIKNSSLCICITRTKNYGDNDSGVNTTFLNTSLHNNESMSNSTVIGDAYNFYIFISIGGVSSLTFLVNFVLLTTACCRPKTTVIDVFGFALMVFNILLSMYGVALTVYLSHKHIVWHQRFCQGITSIKLFALGASVWTLLMLTYHRKIRGDIDDDSEEKKEDKKEDKEKEREEKEKKKKELDAIFKAIVYILEGLMLSGVLAVMSWIKLDTWGYLCIIFEPKTTVDWLLTGIELFYYFMTFCLVIRYPYSLIQKKRKTVSKDKKKKKEKDKSHTIFLMVFICFVIWVTGYVMTLPQYGMFTDQIRRVVRVGALIFPLSIQPIIYIIRNTCCCLCRSPPCKKKREKDKPTDHCVLLVCECTGTETCPGCEPEYLEKFGNTQFNEKEANGGSEKKKKKVKLNKDNKKKKKKRRKNDVIEPKSIERSPILKQRDISIDDAVAETPLLDNDETIEIEDTPLPTKSIDFATDSTPLLDDTDGAKQPPKAVPDNTPVKSTQNKASVNTTEFPSFINMESAVDVDSLPKEKTAKITKLSVNNKLIDADERKSRGPTFFPLAEKKKGVEERPKKKTKKKSEGERNSKNNNHEKKSKRKSKENNKDETNKTNVRNSTISLEWDHYSDSSGSISRVSDCFPDEMIINTSVTTADNGKQNNHNHNGVSTKKQENNTNVSEAEDLNRNGNETLVKKTDLINQKSNGKVTSAV